MFPLDLRPKLIHSTDWPSHIWSVYTLHWHIHYIHYIYIICIQYLYIHYMYTLYIYIIYTLYIHYIYINVYTYITLHIWSVYTLTNKWCEVYYFMLKNENLVLCEPKLDKRVHFEQGDRMSLWKNLPECSSTHFLSTLLQNFYRLNVAQKWTDYLIS
jgi:hypothetical protein